MSWTHSSGPPWHVCSRLQHRRPRRPRHSRVSRAVKGWVSALKKRFRLVPGTSSKTAASNLFSSRAGATRAREYRSGGIKRVWEPGHTFLCPASFRRSSTSSAIAAAFISGWSLAVSELSESRLCTQPPCLHSNDQPQHRRKAPRIAHGGSRLLSHDGLCLREKYPGPPHRRQEG